MKSRDHAFNNVRGAHPASRERIALVFLLVLIEVVYAALGRDVFFNKSNCAVCFSHDARVDLSSYDPIGFYLPYARVFACVLTILTLCARGGVLRTLERIPLLFAPFVVLALASSAWADEPWQAVREAATLLALWAALPPLAHRLGPVATARTTLHVIAAVAIVSCALALLAPSIGRHTGEEIVQAAHAGRWRGVFGHKNGLGAWAAYGSVLLFTHPRLMEGTRFYRWLAGASALTCLIFAGSSTGLIMALALAGAWLFLVGLRHLGAGSTLLLFALVAVVGAFAISVGWEQILSAIGRDATLSGRALVWSLIASHFAESSPFVQGLGAGYQSAGGAELALVLESRFDQPMSPENSYIGLLLGVGIIGMLAFFAPLIASVHNAAKWLRRAAPMERTALEFMLMTIVAALVASLTEATALVATGYDGVLVYVAFFTLLTLPRAPRAVSFHEFGPAAWRAGGRRRHPDGRGAMAAAFQGSAKPSASMTSGSRRPSAPSSSMPP